MIALSSFVIGNDLRSNRRINTLALALFLFVPAIGAEILNGVVIVDQEDGPAANDQIKMEVKLRQLKEAGVNAVCFVPLADLEDIDVPEITFSSQLPRGMEAAIRAAKRLDLKIILKPALSVPAFPSHGGGWRGAIRMASEEDWRAWFDEYGSMINHYAGIAQRLRVDIFVIGTDYDKATIGRDRPWRKIVRSVRAIYKGRLSYDANGVEEADRLPFWDALDVIGVNIHNFADLSWSSYRTNLAVLSSRNANKPVVATTGDTFATLP